MQCDERYDRVQIVITLGEKMAYILEQIGLTKMEAEVYKLLLSFGESPVVDILKETGSHPQIIYRAIDGLVAKGLVLITIKRHRKYVRAEDPKIIEQIEEKKLEKVRGLIPDLLALQKNSKDAIVRIHKGNEAVRSAREKPIKELENEKTFYVIGASGDRFYEIMGERLVEMERARVKKKIQRKMISFENQRAGFKKYLQFPEFSEIRYLPENFSVPSSTLIYDKTTIIFIWSKIPLVIEIESQEVAESYLSYFTTLCKIAKK